ncbi:MAG: zinc transporter [Rhodobacteraceae bacterium]|nr:MAG: zinc transporter [Paracoccaceae bacterium]
MTRLIPLLLTLSAIPALAEVPRVATDIAPVHGLAAQVMEGLGTPDLIVPPDASPHDFALRPSQARALQDAGLVIWIGPDLTPWLARTLGSLSRAETLELNALPDTDLRRWRDLADFGAGHASTEDHDHDHDAADPHSWLDPGNARTWTDAIAAELARQDPENAASYHRNAAAAKAAIDAAAARADARLTPHRDKGFLVFHDAYQYFETRFQVPAAGAIADSAAALPGPGRIRELQARIAAEGIACLFAEPQFTSGLIDTLAEGSGARIAVLDPLGTELELGAGFYPALLGAMAEAMAGCFEG